MTDGRAEVELVPLGDGPVCTVLAGVDEQTGTAYAVRVLPGEVDGGTRQRFAEESRRLGGLRGNASIIVPDGLVRLGDGRWAVRRELAAQSLPELIAFSGPLPAPEAVALGVPLAEALAALHGAGIVHGGVTGGNVLFRASGEPVLTDAGLTLRRMFPPAGTAPPAGHLDERSDLYGLGVVLHVALTGAAPRPGARPEPPVPAGLADLVAALLAERPGHRPPDAETVAAALRRLPVGGGHSPGAEQPRSAGAPALPAGGPPVPVGRPVLEFGPRRRHRWLPRAAAPTWVTVLVLLAVVGAVTLRHRPEEPGVTPTWPAAAPSAAAPGRPATWLLLAEPTDRGDVVDLSWTGSGSFYYAVIVVGEGQPRLTLPAQRGTSRRVPVDRGRRYCFAVRGTDGDAALDSAFRAIRGADCP